MFILRAIWSGWTKFAHVLGAVNTRIILTLVYATLFAIAGIAMKVLRKDPLRRRHRGGESRWLPAHLPTGESDPIAAHRRQF